MVERNSRQSFVDKNKNQFVYIILKCMYIHTYGIMPYLDGFNFIEDNGTISKLGVDHLLWLNIKFFIVEFSSCLNKLFKILGMIYEADVQI